MQAGESAYAKTLQTFLEPDAQITRISLNRQAASIAISYQFSCW
ncbi:hypothetical protein [Nostoc sp. 106C]|nr:hypothetical protein [Nostoc sp. 106C]